MAECCCCPESRHSDSRSHMINCFLVGPGTSRLRLVQGLPPSISRRVFVCVCCVCVHMQARERQRERGVMKCKDTKEQERMLCPILWVCLSLCSLLKRAIVLEAAAQWSGEVVLVECGEHDRCDLKAWICPAPFLCSHHLDCATLRVFNGLFPAIVFRCRAAIMQIRGHVIYRALMTRSNSRKLHKSWLHIDIS